MLCHYRGVGSLLITSTGRRCQQASVTSFLSSLRLRPFEATHRNINMASPRPPPASSPLSRHVLPTTNQPIGPKIHPSGPAEPVTPTTIQGQFVTLVPLLPSHAKDLWPLFNGPENEGLWTYMWNGPYTEFEEFEKMISGLEKSKDPVFFAIIPKGQAGSVLNSRGHGEHEEESSPPPVGFLSYLNISPKNQSIEIGGIHYSHRLQRTAPATEAVYLLIRHAFETLQYSRVEWKCNSLNLPSRRAAERYGFVYEGLFRRQMVAKGRRRDTWWASIVKEEWWGRGVEEGTGEAFGVGDAEDESETVQGIGKEGLSRKFALERWLDEENFDAEGKQKKRLEELQEWKKNNNFNE